MIESESRKLHTKVLDIIDIENVNWAVKLTPEKFLDIFGFFNDKYIDILDNVNLYYIKDAYVNHRGVVFNDVQCISNSLKNNKESHPFSFYDSQVNKFTVEFSSVVQKDFNFHLFSFGYSNFFHFNIEYLAKFNLVSMFNFDNLKVFSNNAFNSWQKALFENYFSHVNLDAVIYPDKDKSKIYNVKEFIYFPPQSIFPNYKFYNEFIIRAFKERVFSSHQKAKESDFCKSRSFEKIYISRRGFDKRSMLNELEVESFFENSGYEIIEPSELTIEEQVCIFKGCKKIVAPPGAALTNLIHCNEDIDVFVFELDYSKIKGGPKSFWSYYAANLGLNYHKLDGDVIEEDIGLDYQKARWRVDIEKLKSNAKLLCL